MAGMSIVNAATSETVWMILAFFAVTLIIGTIYTLTASSMVGGFKGFVTGVIAMAIIILFTLAAIPASASAVEQENLAAFTGTYPDAVMTGEINSLLADPQPGESCHVITSGGREQVLTVRRADRGLVLTPDIGEGNHDARS